MLTNRSEESVWAAGMAARLRLVQVSCADAPASQRRTFLRETLAQSLKGMPASRRDSCLAALADRFPCWGEAAAATPPPPEPTPEELATRLIELSAGLSAERRSALARQFQASGRFPASSAPSGEWAQSVQKFLELPQPPSLERMVSLLTLLIGFVQRLDAVACGTLEALPESSGLNPKRQPRNLVADELQETLKDFLQANDETTVGSTTQRLQRLLDKHRRGMVALMASHVGVEVPHVPSHGAEFAKWFLDWFSPASIEGAAREENGMSLGLPGGLAKRSWQKYVQRFNQLETPSRLDKQVKEAVAVTAERIYQLKL